MTSIKHTATAPDGTVATRTSKSRTYTHAVFVKCDPELIERDYVMSGRAIAQDRKNFAYYVSKGERVGTVEDYVAAEIVRRRERAITDYQKTWCAGWCGRLDLAQKLANKNWSYGGKATIVEAEIK